MPEFRDLALDPAAKYEEIYLMGLKKSHYNFILVDFSYFQFSLVSGNLRYSFLPNPYASLGLDGDAGEDENLAAMLDGGVIDFEEYSDLVIEAPVDIRIPPFRYEYAEGQYKEIHHPASHLHVGNHGGNRWPVRRKLTPQAFSMLILKSYYSVEWGAFDSDESVMANSLNEALVNERARCNILANDWFTAKEERLFFFT